MTIKQWMIVSVVSALAAAFVSSPVLAQRAARGDDGTNAFKRLDHAELAEVLQAQGMKEFIAALAEQTEKSPDLADMFVTSQCWATLALTEVADLDRREQMMADAVERIRACIKISEQIKNEPDYVAYFQHSVALARMLGYDRCALYGDKVLMLIGGPEDRRLLERYTSEVLMPGKDADGQATKDMLSDLQDRMSLKLEDWVSEKWFMTLSPAVEKLQRNLHYYKVWMQFYYALGATDTGEKDTYLNYAIAAADPFLLDDDGDDDPVMIMLQGVAYSELGFAKRSNDRGEIDALFKQAQESLNKAQAIKGIPDTLKINLEFHQCCNLIRWGKFDDALKRINRFPAFMTNLMGQRSLLAADMRVALLKNFLYDSWSAATKDKAKKDELAAQGQAAIMEFITKHAADTEAVGDFLKMLSTKFRGVDVKTLAPLLQYAVGADQFDRFAELNNSKGDPARMEEARKAAGEALDLVIASPAPEVQSIKSKALELRIALGGNWATIADMAINVGTKESLYNAAVIIKKALDGGTAGDTDAARRMLIHLVDLMAPLPDFQSEPASKEMFYDQGEQYRALAQRSVPDEEMIDFLDAGAKAYASVPANSPRLSLASKFLNLNLRHNRLLALKDSSMADLVKARNINLVRQADELAADLDAFVTAANAVRTNAATVKADPDLAKDIPSWVAMVQFNKGVLLWELRNDNDQGRLAAEQIFTALRREHKDSPIVLLSWEYQIRRAIEDGNTQVAIDGIGQIQKQAPEQATALMSQVILQVQANVARMKARDSAEDRQKLPTLRKTYQDFAKRLLDNVPANQDRTGYEQLYADALLENGSAGEALQYFTRLRDAEEKKRQAETAKIDKLVDGKLKELNDKTMNEAIKQLGVDFPKFVIAQGLSADSPFVKEVTAAVGRINQANQTDAADIKYQINSLTNAMRRGYEQVRTLLKSRIPVSLINIQGLARCHHKLAQDGQDIQKNYVEAMKLYDQLSANLSPVNFPVEYWRAQLERTQCLFDQTMSQNLPDVEKQRSLRALLQWIDSYRKRGGIDPTILGQFRNLEAKIKTAGGL